MRLIPLPLREQNEEQALRLALGGHEYEVEK